jgi:hypothetical protein
MVLDFYKDAAVKQCDLAARAFGKKCCNTPSSSLCNQPLADANISELWKASLIQRRYVANSVPFDVLRSEIEAGRPVEVAFALNGGYIGHVVIVRGWGQDAQGPYLLVNDPARGRGKGTVHYTDLLTANGSGVWDATWTGLRR